MCFFFQPWSGVESTDPKQVYSESYISWRFFSPTCLFTYRRGSPPFSNRSRSSRRRGKALAFPPGGKVGEFVFELVRAGLGQWQPWRNLGTCQPWRTTHFRTWGGDVMPRQMNRHDQFRGYVRRCHLTCDNLDTLVYLHEVWPKTREWEVRKKLRVV
jgi:hypothetical protein